MQVVITARDGKNAQEKRARVRPAHLENMAKVKGKVLCAGGLLDSEGKTSGSLLVMEFGSQEELDEYLAHEPYITEKVWEDVRTESMNVVILNGEKIGR